MIDFTLANTAIEMTMGEDDEGAEAVVWLAAPTRVLTGVFDSRHFDVTGFGEVTTSELMTTLSVKDDPLDPPQVGEKVVIRKQVYRIKDRRPDAEGWAVLELERSAM